MKLSNKKSLQGFTLIELLIVIAVLGVLAAVVLVAINPLEQLARGRDAGRKSTLGQLANAVQAYYTSRNGVYPVADATWISTLVTAGEVRNVPAASTYSITGSAPCTTNVQPANGYCYTATVGVGAVAGAWVRLESSAEDSKCAAGTNPYFMWDSSATRNNTCLVCGAADPALATACNATQ
ncbi:MAG: type II secretion system protein [Candidatus Levybacteria bacterium]|nr:type II secretion system protein [Candidatus Levybacteria bacterium]